jgi:hypothetical protein
MSNEIGKRFAEAIAAKDSGALLEVLDPDVDFRGLTPGRFWEATSATMLVDDFVLGKWFEPSDHIDALEEVQSGSVAGRDRVSYLLRITNDDGTFLVEQQAYYDVENDRITWLRVLCSGFRAIDA